ncbi:MAG: MFS transporter [Nanoarchaeales archaeon]|nr:MFS transporter [Nanoarchaeales archaeon]
MVKEKKKENQLLNILLNLVIPSVILIKFSTDNYLGPIYGMIVALSFPIIYGIYEFTVRKDINIVSIFGFISILLTGGISLFELSKNILIIKETSIPLLIIVFMMIFKEKTNKFLKNMFAELFDFDKISKKIGDKKLNNHITELSKLLKFPFLVSAALNFTLAFVLIQSAPGTVEYNAQIGKMTALSFPMIALPSMVVMIGVLYLFIKRMTKDTGYKFEELMVQK